MEARTSCWWVKANPKKMALQHISVSLNMKTTSILERILGMLNANPPKKRAVKSATPRINTTNDTCHEKRDDKRKGN